MKNSRTAIDNIFIDIIKVENFITSPLSNGLSDHDAQTLEIYIHNSVCKEATHNIRTMRKINKHTTTDLIKNLARNYGKIYSEILTLM
jgi:hypothetical protein